MTFQKTFSLLHVLCKNLVRWFVILRMYFGLFQSIFMRSTGKWKIPIEYKVNLKNYAVVSCVIVFIALSNCRFYEYHSGLIHRHLSRCQWTNLEQCGQITNIQCNCTTNHIITMHITQKKHVSTITVMEMSLFWRNCDDIDCNFRWSQWKKNSQNDNIAIIVIYLMQRKGRNVHINQSINQIQFC